MHNFHGILPGLYRSWNFQEKSRTFQETWEPALTHTDDFYDATFLLINHLLLHWKFCSLLTITVKLLLK